MKFLIEILDLQHNQCDDFAKATTSICKSTTQSVGDMKAEDTPQNKKIQTKINKLNRLIFNCTDEARLIKLTAYRDKLKQQLNKTLPDTQHSALGVGSNSSSAFNRSG